MKLTTLLFLLSAISFAACQAEQADDNLTKADAQRLDGKSDSGLDLCELFGWYDDGICDSFCVLPDPACGPNWCPDPSAPEVHYVSDSVGQCATLLFACEDWQTPFTDECGCGCLGPEEAPPVFCGGFGNIPCADGLTCVDDPSDDCDLGDGADCGGICVEEVPDSCPDPTDPEVYYIGDLDECSVILFACEPWQTAFSDECGCGCIGPETADFCGGFANLPCEDGFICVDDPSDDCELNDGADCGGICVLD